MPSHTGEQVRSTGASKVFEDQNKNHRHEEDMPNAEFDGFFITSSSPILALSLEDKLEEITGTEVSKIQTQMIGWNFVFATKDEIKLRHITLRTSNGTINVTLVPNFRKFTAGEIIEHLDLQYAVVEDFDLVEVIENTCGKSKPFNAIPTGWVFIMLCNQKKLVLLSGKHTTVKSDAAVDTLVKK